MPATDLRGLPEMSTKPSLKPESGSVVVWCIVFGCISPLLGRGSVLGVFVELSLATPGGGG